MATLKDKAEMLSQTSANIQVKNDVTQLGRRFESLLAAVKVCYVAYVSRLSFHCLTRYKIKCCKLLLFLYRTSCKRLKTLLPAMRPIRKLCKTHTIG